MQVEFHVHHAKEAARVAKILSVIDPKTGKVSKKAPRCVIAKQSAVIEVVIYYYYYESSYLIVECIESQTRLSWFFSISNFFNFILALL